MLISLCSDVYVQQAKRMRNIGVSFSLIKTTADNLKNIKLYASLSENKGNKMTHETCRKSASYKKAH
jgi:hypothetical protein